MSIEIEKLHAGYKLTAYPHRSLVLRAVDLLTLMDYATLHETQLRQEAQAELVQEARAKGWPVEGEDPERLQAEVKAARVEYQSILLDGIHATNSTDEEA